MGNVTGMAFDAVYARLPIIGMKVYFAGLRRLKVTRWSRRRGFKTATQALEYARRWAGKAETMLKAPEAEAAG